MAVEALTGRFMALTRRPVAELPDLVSGEKVTADAGLGTGVPSPGTCSLLEETLALGAGAPSLSEVTLAPGAIRRFNVQTPQRLPGPGWASRGPHSQESRAARESIERAVPSSVQAAGFEGGIAVESRDGGAEMGRLGLLETPPPSRPPALNPVLIPTLDTAGGFSSKILLRTGLAGGADPGRSACIRPRASRASFRAWIRWCSSSPRAAARALSFATEGERPRDPPGEARPKVNFCDQSIASSKSPSPESFSIPEDMSSLNLRRSSTLCSSTLPCSTKASPRKRWRRPGA
mmetsp:Transcript_50243/g.114032  ORF Transcript_50243/g.114032 Transcript_50243/m.114032 type:complete len:291 (-) Transcript_50243:1138-2010(-)